MRLEILYTVKEKKGNVNYKIYSDDEKRMMIVDVDRIKKFHEENTDVKVNKEQPKRKKKPVKNPTK